MCVDAHTNLDRQTGQTLKLGSRFLRPGRQPISRVFLDVILVHFYTSNTCKHTIQSFVIHNINGKLLLQQCRCSYQIYGCRTPAETTYGSSLPTILHLDPKTLLDRTLDHRNRQVPVEIAALNPLSDSLCTLPEIQTCTLNHAARPCRFE